MFNNLIGGGNTQAFKNYAQQATEIVTKNNSKITPQPLQNSLQVLILCHHSRFHNPLPPQQVPILCHHSRFLLLCHHSRFYSSTTAGSSSSSFKSKCLLLCPNKL